MRDITIQPGLVIPARELEVSFARSGGPGGQNVNKVSSKVTLRWAFSQSQVLPLPAAERLRALAANRLSNDGWLQFSSQANRDQPANLQACILKLRQLVLQALVSPKARKATRPTLGSKNRRMDDKAKRGQVKAGRRAAWES
jgi:ribosome-associated protein